MKPITLLSILCLFSVSVWAQQPVMDSLMAVLKTQKEDTNKVKTLNLLSEKLWRIGNLEKAMNYAEQAKTLSEQKKYKKGIGNALGNMGVIYYFSGKNAEALDNYSRALKIRQEEGDEKGVAGIYNNMGIIYDANGDVARTLEYYTKALRLREKTGDKVGAAMSHGNIGNVYVRQGDYPKALISYSKVIGLRKELLAAAKTKKEIALSTLDIGAAQGDIGVICMYQGDYPKALQNYFQELKVLEELLRVTPPEIKPDIEKRANEGIANALSNIGVVCTYQNDYPKALEYTLRSLTTRTKNGDKLGSSNALNTAGLIYQHEHNLPRALDYYLQSLKLSEETMNQEMEGATLLNIGSVYSELGDNEPRIERKKEHYIKAEEYYRKAIAVSETTGNKRNLVSCWANLGALQTKLKKFIDARRYLDQSLAGAKEIGSNDEIRNSYRFLASLDSLEGKWKQAYEDYSKYIVYRDSLLNEENTKKSVQAEMNFAFDKKEQAAKLEQEKKDAIVNEEKQRLTVIRNSFIGGFLLVLVLALVVFRSYRQKQKDNVIITRQKEEVEGAYKLIEEQKHIVEEKHKEITDSINYAERIQRSFLATEQLLNANLKDYFVLFLPKDVVSGDFYWAAKLQNGNFAVVTADSTGHGVPGAIMSILNISCLEKSVEEKGLSEPAEILNHTRVKIIERLKKDGSPDGGKDGMDCSLISFDFKNNSFSYAAANNPVWIVRGSELLEFSPDKMPVGKHDKEHVPFTQHAVGLQPGDVVYAITDGMPDQFGGPKGKKFMYKQLKELLIAIAGFPMQEQKSRLSEALVTWKGNLDQVDDVTVVGVRI